jgi:hypothetical protein
MEKEDYPKIYRGKFHGIKWEFETRDTGWTNCYMIIDGKRGRAQLDGIDVEACLQYVFSTWNQPDATPISLKKLLKGEYDVD